MRSSSTSAGYCWCPTSDQLALRSSRSGSRSMLKGLNGRITPAFGPWTRPARTSARRARAAGLTPVHFDPYELCPERADHAHVARLLDLDALLGTLSD